MDDYRIELAAIEHLVLLAAIETAAASIFPPGILPPLVQQESVPLDVLRSAHAAGRVWVALQASGAPVGFALAGMASGEAHLAELDVHPNHARRGLGRGLVQAVVQWAREEWLPAVSLTTFRDVPWNAPFYERLGFRQLAADELSPELATALAAEQARGLLNRVAMRLVLSRQ